jgi:hypothetical protein
MLNSSVVYGGAFSSRRHFNMIRLEATLCLILGDDGITRTIHEPGT